jgi:hypothetical protein
MIRILSVFVLAVFGALSTLSANAADTSDTPPDAPPQLAATAPNHYVVVSGDTLWGISARFLQEPWRWPEIWRMNRDQIKNPDRIYPGDVIVVDRDANGNPFLRIDSRSIDSRPLDSRRIGSRRIDSPSLDSRRSPQIYEEPLTEAIPPIPPNVIDPFIATPLFVEQNTLRSAPRIVATQEDRVFLGRGDTAYVEGADAAQKQWELFRNGRPVYDPERPGARRIIGYEAFHLGTATQEAPGKPATFRIDSAKQEIGSGDRLVPAIRPELVDYIPHAPEHDIDGRVASVYGGVGTGGHLSIVLLNRGSADGMEIGHVLALERNRTVVQRDENDRQYSVTIPPVRYGLVFVFRIFENAAYALAVQTSGTIEINDFVRTPK